VKCLKEGPFDEIPAPKGLPELNLPAWSLKPVATPGETQQAEILHILLKRLVMVI